jgi:hypothetical protein
LDDTNNSNTGADTTSGNMDPLAGDASSATASPTAGNGWDPNAGQFSGGMAGAFDPLAGAGIVAGAAGSAGQQSLEEWAPMDPRFSTGQTGDLLADFDASQLVASTDIRVYFTNGGKYSGWLEVTGMKYQEMALSKKHGVMLPIQCLFIEYQISVNTASMTTADGSPLPDDVDPTVKGLFIVPIRTKPGHTLATQVERDKFQEALSRGEKGVGSFYAFAEMPLMPDPKANNRLAPLGTYAVPAGAVDAQGRKRKPGLHENWRDGLLDYKITAKAGEDGGPPMGFPCTFKWDGSGFLNPEAVDKAQITAHLQREADARRQAALAAEGLHNVANTYTPDASGSVAGQGFTETTIPSSPTSTPV